MSRSDNRTLHALDLAGNAVRARCGGQPAFLRFDAPDCERDKHSWQPQGLFAIAWALEQSHQLEDLEVEWLHEIRRWFEAHLRRPLRFSSSRRKTFTRNDGISWFRESAREHIQHMQELVALLREHGVRVRMRRTCTPGYVLYQDAHQVVAVPFDGT